MLDNFRVSEQSEVETQTTYTVRPTLTFTDKDLEDENTRAFFEMCGGTIEDEVEATAEITESVSDVESAGYFQV